MQSKDGSKSEGSIKKTIEEFLEYHQNLGNLVWNRQNSGQVIVYSGPQSRYKVKLCHVGTPDIVVHRNGLTLYIEVKSKEGKLKPEQVNFHKLLYAQGINTYTVRSVEEVQKRLGFW